MSFMSALSLWPLLFFGLVIWAALRPFSDVRPNPDDALIQAGLTDEEIREFNQCYGMTMNTRK